MSNLFHFTGNLPKLVDEYDIDVDYNRLYDSFMKFMELSSLSVDRYKLA